jgi:hypothetical protein
VAHENASLIGKTIAKLMRAGGSNRARRRSEKERKKKDKADGSDDSSFVCPSKHWSTKGNLFDKRRAYDV